MNQIKPLAQSCPVCNSIHVEEFLRTDLTTFFFPLPKTLLDLTKKEPFKLNICRNCSFIFQIDVKQDLIELIYNIFYKHYNLDTSVEFQEVYRERTILFMNNLLKNNSEFKILDLGCGEGTYFPFFESLGYDCYGIEPSKKAKIAKEKNPNATISPKFFEELNEDEFDTKFDVILMNWVLEHISDLDTFFNKLGKHIRNKSKLIIQVPDIRYYFNNFLPLFYVHEHINYFTIETLTLLLESKGYEVTGNKHGDSPSILICAEYTGIEKRREVKNQILYQTQKQFLKDNFELKEKFSSAIANYENIVFYGMGLLAFWIGDNCMNRTDNKKIDLIDDNEFYKNKLVPLFNKKLTNFPIGSILNDTLIIISTSPVYHKKIRKIIKEKFIGNYQIAYIDGISLVIE